MNQKKAPPAEDRRDQSLPEQNLPGHILVMILALQFEQ